MVMQTCLLVDDDEEIRSGVAAYLGRFGFATTTASDGREMRRRLAEKRYDIVVLDLMLPDEDGLSLCRHLRSAHRGTPVVMLTAQSDPTSRVVGLEMGADDYLGKPFEPRELVARLHAVLRRAGGGSAGVAPDDDGSTPSRVGFVGWRFDRLRRQLVSPAGVAIALSSAEFRLLSAFVERPQRLLSRERLIELTRASGVDVSDRSIDLAVSRLRAKLGEAGSGPAGSLIRTVRGEGYLFDAKVDAA